MKTDKVMYGLKSMMVLFSLLLASLFLQISSDVERYDIYGISPGTDTNRFLGYALLLGFAGLLLCVYTLYQYKKTKR